MGVKRSSGTARWEEQLVLEWKRYAARRTRSADRVAAGVCFLEARPCPFETRPDFETRFTHDCVHCARMHGAIERSATAPPGSSGILPTLGLLVRLLEEEAGAPALPTAEEEDGRYRAAALLLRALPLLHASSHPTRAARLLLAAIAGAYREMVDTLLFFEVAPETAALSLRASFRHADLDIGIPTVEGYLDLDTLEAAGAFDSAVFDRLREAPIPLDHDRDLLADAVFDGRTAVVQSPGRELRLPTRLVEHLPDAPIVILPIFGRERVRGLLILSASPGIAGWTSDQIEILTAVASQAGIAFESSTLLDLARRRGATLRALSELASVSLRASSSETPYAAALRVLLQALGAQVGVAWERTFSDAFSIASALGEPAATERDLLEVGEALRHWLEADPRPILIENARSDPRLPGTLPPEWGSALALALRDDDVTRGALLLVRAARSETAAFPFDPEDAQMAEVVASTAALVGARRTSEEEAARAARRIQELEAQLKHAEKLAAVGERGIQVAQEIRNPVAAITGFARRVLRGIAPEDPNREYLEIILRETERLERILVEQVSLSQLTRPRLKLSSLNALVQEVLELQSEELVRRRVRLLKRLSPEVPSLLLDNDKMRQVLINVLQYALRQVPSGGRVRVETRSGAGHVQAEVAHDGPKTPGESLERLFVPFSASRRYGAGVGLAVAYQIVREHGGEIRARSEGDWSSILTIYLPVRENQDRRGKPDRRAGRNDRRRRLG
jgi:signal transduction histidine kinase